MKYYRTLGDEHLSARLREHKGVKLMSKASKWTFGISCVVTAVTVAGVHLVQGWERDTLRLGPVKDAKRLEERAKKMELRDTGAVAGGAVVGPPGFNGAVDAATRERQREANAREHEEQLALRQKYAAQQAVAPSGK